MINELMVEVGKVHATFETSRCFVCVLVFAPHFRLSDGKLRWGGVPRGTGMGMAGEAATAGAQNYAGLVRGKYISGYGSCPSHRKEHVTTTL